MKAAVSSGAQRASDSSSSGRPTPPPLKVVPRRRYGQAIVATIGVLGVTVLLVSIWQSPNIDHSVVAEYLTAGPIMEGLLTTLKLTILAGFLGGVVGVVVAVMRLSGSRALSGLSWLYIWCFRGSPLLVQLLFWGYFGLIFEHLTIGIPFTDIYLARVDTNDVITAFVAAVLGLGLNEGAYMAEVVRGGIIAVDSGQTEAAKAVGMTPSQTMRRVIMPQAMRVIIPPTGNQVINLLKASSLVSVLAAGDLLTNAQNISAVNFRTVELLIVATFWYFVIVSILNVGQVYLERRAGRGYRA